MSLAANVILLAQAMGTQLKGIKASIGTLSSLSTTEKTSLVGAVNELQSAMTSLATAAGASILDTATTGDTTHTWSADKIISAIAQAKSDLVDGAPEAMNTLMEIVSKLTSEDSAINGLLTAVNNRVSYADDQSLTTAQKLKACTNIGIGDPETDFVAAFNAALA